MTREKDDALTDHCGVTTNDTFLQRTGQPSPRCKNKQEGRKKKQAGGFGISVGALPVVAGSRSLKTTIPRDSFGSLCCDEGRRGKRKAKAGKSNRRRA